jgi:hypothetical protein
MLNRIAQVGLKIESAEGTEESLTAAEFRGNRKETGHRYAPGEYDRELEKGSLTMDAMLKGSSSLTITLTSELVGGAVATVAPWHSELRALGFKATPAKLYTTANPSGSINTGEIVTDTADASAANKRGQVLLSRAGDLFIEMLSGSDFSDTDTVYGQGSGGGSREVATAGADAGYSFRPLSETDSDIPPSVTAERRLGGQRHTLVGGRATGGLSLKWNEPALLRSEITGVPLFDVTAGVRSPKAGSALSVTPFTAPPVVCKGIPLTFRPASGSTYTPIATELAINLSNTLEQRQTITASLGGNYESAHLATRITARELSATIDPEHVLPAAGFDFIDALQRGVTFEISAQLGAVTDANGALMIFAPAGQMSGDYEPGDRNGTTTSPMNVRFTGTGDDELVISHLFANA